MEICFSRQGFFETYFWLPAFLTISVLQSCMFKFQVETKLFLRFCFVFARDSFFKYFRVLKNISRKGSTICVINMYSIHPTEKQHSMSQLFRGRDETKLWATFLWFPNKRHCSTSSMVRTLARRCNKNQNSKNHSFDSICSTSPSGGN